MPPKLDFGSIMAELEVFQREVGKIQASLKNPKQKEILGEALQRVASAKVDAEKTYPEAMKTIRERTEQAQARANSAAAEAAKLKQKFEQMAQAPPVDVKPPEKEAPRFDAQLGEKLSDELMNRLRARPAGEDDGQPIDREIWEDWNWEADSASSS